MKRILVFLLSCMLWCILTACSNLENGQLTDIVNSSDVKEENSKMASEEMQDVPALPQSSAVEKPTSEPDALVSHPVSKEQDTPPTVQQPNQDIALDTKSVESEENMVSKMNVQIGNSSFTATLADNSTVESFVAMMKSEPIVINMSDYSGFEKVGSLGTSLPINNSQIKTQAGDIVLYNGNQIVIFYGSNSWSYTRLGKIDNLSGWEEALGNGDVEVTFRLE